MTTNLLSKKVIIVAIIAAGAVSAILVASSIARATAQQQKMMWSVEGIPKINGSVNVANETSNFINENVNVSFVKAAETAQGQAADGRVLGGHLGVVQGYLVYTFFVANTGNQGHLVVVDAGNDDVLYTSEGQPFGSFDYSMSGQWGGHIFGGWGGPWKAHGWGMWS